MPSIEIESEIEIAGEIEIEIKCGVCGSCTYLASLAEPMSDYPDSEFDLDIDLDLDLDEVAHA